MGNGQALRGIVCQELEYRVKSAVVPSINRLHLLDQKQTLERQGIMGFVDRDPRVPVHKTVDAIRWSTCMMPSTYIASTVSWFRMVSELSVATS